MDSLITLLPERIKSLPTYMDFEGQRKAERIYQLTILIFAVVGFGTGYLFQQFAYVLCFLAAGFITSAAESENTHILMNADVVGRMGPLSKKNPQEQLVLPPWPMYRRSPVQWQPARDFDDGVAAVSGQMESSPRKEKKKK